MMKGHHPPTTKLLLMTTVSFLVGQGVPTTSGAKNEPFLSEILRLLGVCKVRLARFQWSSKNRFIKIS